MSQKRGVIYSIVLVLLVFTALLVRKLAEPVLLCDQMIVVEDSYLDDSKVFAEDYSADVGAVNYSVKQLDHGAFTDYSDDYTKCFFDYEGQINQAVKFRLKPYKNGDYIVTIPKTDGLYVEVMRRNTLVYNSQVKAEVQEIEADKIQYHCRLDKGYIYDIYVMNDQEKELTANVAIEQDNWIYAPLGGYAKFDKKRVNYLSRENLFKSRRVWYALLGDYDGPDPEYASMNEEKRHQYACGINDMIINLMNTSDQSKKRFLKYYDKMDVDDFLQTLVTSDFNIKFSTSDALFSYEFNYSTWKNPNYISKYQNNKRASTYIVYTTLPDKETLVSEEGLEWVRYLR